MNAPTFFRLVIEQQQFIRHLRLHSRIEQLFAKMLLLHPFTEKERKVWDKFKNNRNVQFGLLSRKLIKAAKAVNLPKQLITHYVITKSSYKYYQKQTYEEINQNQSAENLIREVYTLGQNTESARLKKFEFHELTKLLLECVLDKSDKEVNKLMKKYD